MPLINKAFLPSLSTFETPPGVRAYGSRGWVNWAYVNCP